MYLVAFLAMDGVFKSELVSDLRQVMLVLRDDFDALGDEGWLEEFVTEDDNWDQWTGEETRRHLVWEDQKRQTWFEVTVVEEVRAPVVVLDEDVYAELKTYRSKTVKTVADVISNLSGAVGVINGVISYCSRKLREG